MIAQVPTLTDFSGALTVLAAALAAIVAVGAAVGTLYKGAVWVVDVIRAPQVAQLAALRSDLTTIDARVQRLEERGSLDPALLEELRLVRADLGRLRARP